MLCAVCEKESKNLRVCPFCHTPYTTEPVTGAGRRASSMRMAHTPAAAKGAPGAGLSDLIKGQVASLWALFQRQTPVVRYSSAGIVLVIIFWWATREEPQFEAGVVQSEVIATPLQRDEALAVIKQTRESAVVDIQQDEVFVSYPAATFPVLEAGQLALVQQFTNADEIVEGRKRRIYYYNPNGKLFAQADGVRGVVLVR
jgi:hypothetical protein